MIWCDPERVLLVPELGVPVESGMIAALLAALDLHGGIVARGIDLEKEVLEEHAGERMTEQRLRQLAERKLGRICRREGLLWEPLDEKKEVPDLLVVFGDTARLTRNLSTRCLYINPVYNIHYYVWDAVPVTSAEPVEENSIEWLAALIYKEAIGRITVMFTNELMK